MDTDMDTDDYDLTTTDEHGERLLVDQEINPAYVDAAREHLARFTMELASACAEVGNLTEGESADRHSTSTLHWLYHEMIRLTREMEEIVKPTPEVVEP